MNTDTQVNETGEVEVKTVTISPETWRKARAYAFYNEISIKDTLGRAMEALQDKDEATALKGVKR